MCGFLACMALSGGLLPGRKPIETAVNTLFHRGPDDCGIWLSSSDQMALAHRQLSIIDLQSGHQPIANETNTIHMVANGEFYGYQKIRQALSQRGHHLATRTDSEIVLHLYEEKGAGCLADLRGEFAFTLWDQREQTLFAARDRFGIKPLYYTVHKNVLFLASEIKALLALGVPAVWDQEAYYQICRFIAHMGDPEKTLFKGIYQVPPGHYLLATRERLRLYPYWDLNYPTQDEVYAQSMPEEEIIAQTRSLLINAVKERLEADVPVTFYLSGGIDSSSVLGMAQQHLMKKPEAFTIHFAEKAYSELAIAEETARHLQVDLHPVLVTQKAIADHLTAAVYHTESIFCDNEGVAKFIMSRAVHQAGYKVALTGDGGDEVFAGYPGFVQDMILYGKNHDTAQSAALLDKLRRQHQIAQGMFLPSEKEEKKSYLDSIRNILGFVPTWLSTWDTTGQTMQYLLAEDFAEKFKQRDLYKSLLNRFPVTSQLANREPLAIALYAWAKTALPQHILSYETDRTDMAHSIESRVPFLDHKLVEYVKTIPADLLIKGSTEKYILKEAAKPYITQTIYKRSKHPFTAPPATFSPNQALHQLTQDTLRSAEFYNNVPFFAKEKVIVLLDAMHKHSDTEKITTNLVLNLMLTTALLQKQFRLNC